MAEIISIENNRYLIGDKMFDYLLKHALGADTDGNYELEPEMYEEMHEEIHLIFTVRIKTYNLIDNKVELYNYEEFEFKGNKTVLMVEISTDINDISNHINIGDRINTYITAESIGRDGENKFILHGKMKIV